MDNTTIKKQSHLRTVRRVSEHEESPVRPTSPKRLHSVEEFVEQLEQAIADAE